MVRPVIGYRIRERRRTLGLTQASVAAQVGISASYLNLIEANKRPIAGALLRRITDVLDLDMETLTGRAERRMIQDLMELAAEPTLRDFRVDESSADDLVGRHPEWAGALLTCWRAYRDQAQTTAALSDRLNQDPEVAAAVHELLTHVTAVRSVSEILDLTDDIDPDRRRRFHAMLSAESERLSQASQALAAFFDSAADRLRPATAAEEVDDVIIENGNHFPTLEAAGEELSGRIARHGRILLGALAEHLEEAHGVAVSSRSPLETDGLRFRNLCSYDAASRSLVFLDHASFATRQFQMARLAAELGVRDAIEQEARDRRLTSPASRAQAFRAFASYVASAVVFPYERMLNDAEAARYDIELLRQRYNASFEQVAHRLVTLRRPGREGIPFGFLRSNPAGFTTKRFPLPGLSLPRHGHGCPLWALYEAFQVPGRVVRQVVRFPDNASYLFVASSVVKQPAPFHEPSVPHAVMLACDVIHADKTVYADGLDLAESGPTTVPVGPGCRLCRRVDCLHRAEEPIVRAAGA